MKSNWDIVKLGEIVDFNTGKLDSNQAEDNGIYPFFTCSPTTLTINKEAFDTEAVLLAGNNANGIFSVKYYKGKFNAYQRTYVVTPKDRNSISTKWLYFRIKHVTKELQQLSVGSATKFLTKKILDNFEIKLPSINTQDKIAKILWSLEDKIELNRKMNQTLEEMAQALFKSWFVDFDPVHAKAGCNTDDELEAAAKKLGISKEVLELFPSEFVESEMGMIPLGWEEYKLSDVLEIKYGKDHKRLADGNIPVYGSGGVMRYADNFLYDKESILIPRKGTLTNLFYIDEPFWTVDTIFWSKINTEKVSGKFLFSFLKTIDLSNLNVGSAVPSLTTKVLNEINILIPRIDELKGFNDYADSSWRKIKSNRKQIKILEEIRNTLLPKLLSGELDILKINIEQKEIS